MDYEIWLAIGVCAIGTFAMRMLPLLWMQRHLAKTNNQNTNELPEWLSLLGPLMIAAMCGSSLMPVRQDWIGVLATLIGVTTTVMAWRRFRSLGRPVFIGVLTFGLTTALATLIVN